MVQCAGSPICVAHADMTFTRSKVKVKVTGLLNVQKLHFSKSISSASLPRSSKLMVDYGGMGPSLQLVAARFLNFLLSSYHVISNFLQCRHYRTFKGQYFPIAWRYSHMGECAGSSICIMYAGVNMTRSKLKSRSRGNNRQLLPQLFFSWLYCSIFCTGHISVLLYYHTRKCCWSAQWLIRWLVSYIHSVSETGVPQYSCT